MKQWFDKYGLLHNEPQPYVSTNSALFTAEYYMLKTLLGSMNHLDRARLLSSFLSLREDGIWYEYADLSSQHWSHDNKTGVEAISYLLRLGLNEGNSWDHLHPRDLIFYGMCNGSKLASLFAPVLMVIHIISCLKKYKVRGDNKFIHTDGKILAFMRMQALKNTSWWMKLSWKLCTKIIKRSKIFYGWAGVFKTYFRHSNHPINQLIIEVKCKGLLEE
jgi:hypothetical protein